VNTDHPPSQSPSDAQWTNPDQLLPTSIFPYYVRQCIAKVSNYLDENASEAYKTNGGPNLAQTWARVTKPAEEAGEAIAELILLTGQNPRKPADPAAYAKLLKELSDTAWAAIFAIEHMTNDHNETDSVLRAGLEKALQRVEDGASNAKP